MAQSAYHFMGRGLHIILQNEDTLETLHNPYKKTEAFVDTTYKTTNGGSKYTNKKMVFYACLAIYNSTHYQAFIASQDEYIR